MITIKPTLFVISAFDAKNEKVVTFSWNGNQAFKNTCTIRNNTTNTIVYQQTQDTLQLRHTIPALSLANGTLYNVTVKVIDRANNVSEESSPVLFYCYSTPTFKINMSEGQSVQNSSYPLEITYSQTQGEQLQLYQILLYNSSRTQIWTSGVKYDTSNKAATVSGLEDNNLYYIRAIGQTINDMELDTGYISFGVNYIQPAAYAVVLLENNAKQGSILLKSNIITLEGIYSNGSPTYIDGEYINLTNNDNVRFDAGFRLDDDFTINLKGYGFIDFSTVMVLSNGENSIALTKNKGIYASENNIEKVYLELKVDNAINNYVVRSNFIDTPTDTDILSIWVRRKDSVYEIYAVNLNAA